MVIRGCRFKRALKSRLNAASSFFRSAANRDSSRDIAGAVATGLSFFFTTDFLFTESLRLNELFNWLHRRQKCDIRLSEFRDLLCCGEQ